jgi:hypothetical protein
MSKMISAVVLALLAGNASAEWTVVNRGDRSDSYVDIGSVRASGGTVKMWNLKDYAKPIALETKTYSSATMLEEYDCQDRRARVLQSSAYQGRMRTGDNVHNARDVPWEWTYPEPGTVGERMLIVACSTAGK